jgi:HAD superfamily hydrolase (TIGR01509 family)
MRVRVILFDAGGVLYFRPRRWQHLRAFLSELGLAYIKAKHPDRLALKHRAHAGQLKEIEYHDAVLDLLGVWDPVQRQRGRAVLALEERDIQFFEGVRETCHRLKARGYLLGVVTNTYISTDEKREWYRRAGIDHLLDTFATSCEVGINKPDPRIYQAALDPLGVPVGEAAFVGHTTAELEGARALGMFTVAFSRKGKALSADHQITRFPDLLEILPGGE